MKSPVWGVFRTLRGFNDRVWIAGAFVSKSAPGWLGGTPIGVPIVGWVAHHFGPRRSLGVGAASGFAAAAAAMGALAYRAPRPAP